MTIIAIKQVKRKLNAIVKVTSSLQMCFITNCTCRVGFVNIHVRVG